MGREVRRVPANWQHPKISVPDYKTGTLVEQYQPMFDRPFAPAMREWYGAWQAWERGERPEYFSEENEGLQSWEYESAPPDPAFYRPDWRDEECTHLMMYENTSEGTPISPAFLTPEELALWLVENNASMFGRDVGTYEQWLSIAKGGWTPDLVCIPGQGITTGIELQISSNG